MPNDMIDRLRSAANAIDERSGDYEMHYLLLEAAGAIDDALSMRLQIANRLPLEMLADGKCDTWSGTLSAVHRMKTERNNALTEAQAQAVEKFAGDFVYGVCNGDGVGFEGLDESMFSGFARDYASSIRDKARQPITNPPENSSQEQQP
jgi:hypothetical protein